MADNDQDFYKEFKERMNIDPLKDISGNGDNKPSTSGNHTITIVAAVITGILVSTLIGWYFIGNLIVSKTGSVDDVNNIPTINRVSTPIKIKPEDEGGMKIANQEKKVYDLIGQNNSKDITRERVVSNKIPAVAPSEEEYLENDPEYQDDEAPVKPEKEDKIANLIKQVDEKSLEPIKVAEVKKVVPAAVVTPAKEVVAMNAPSDKAPIRIIPKEEPKAVVKSESPKKEMVKDAFAVQVLSTKDEAQTKTALANLIKKIPDVKKMPTEIQKADLGAKGIYYRLKVGSFKTREEANAVCQKFKAKGQDCIATTK